MEPSYQKSIEAENDWSEIVRYTLRKFGAQQVQKYTNYLLRCLEDLSAGLGEFKEMSVSNHHVLVKRCEQHYIFGLKEVNQPLLIIALLHEKMDLMERLKDRL